MRLMQLTYICPFVLLQMPNTEWEVSPKLYSYYLMVGFLFCLDVDGFIIPSITLQITLKKMCYYVKSIIQGSESISFPPAETHVALFPP